MFRFNKPISIEERISDFLKCNYDIASTFVDCLFKSEGNKVFYPVLKDNLNEKMVLIKLEMYIYLYFLCDWFLCLNKVDKSIREMFGHSAYISIIKTKLFRELSFDENNIKNIYNN